MVHIYDKTHQLKSPILELLKKIELISLHESEFEVKIKNSYVVYKIV